MIKKLPFFFVSLSLTWSNVYAQETEKKSPEKPKELRTETPKTPIKRYKVSELSFGLFEHESSVDTSAYYLYQKQEYNLSSGQNVKIKSNLYLLNETFVFSPKQRHVIGATVIYGMGNSTQSSKPGSSGKALINGFFNPTLGYAYRLLNQKFRNDPIDFSFIILYTPDLLPSQSPAYSTPTLSDHDGTFAAGKHVISFSPQVTQAIDDFRFLIKPTINYHSSQKTNNSRTDYTTTTSSYFNFNFQIIGQYYITEQFSFIGQGTYNFFPHTNQTLENSGLIGTSTKSQSNDPYSSFNFGLESDYEIILTKINLYGSLQETYTPSHSFVLSQNAGTTVKGTFTQQTTYQFILGCKFIF